MRMTTQHMDESQDIVCDSLYITYDARQNVSILVIGKEDPGKGAGSGGSEAGLSSLSAAGYTGPSVGGNPDVCVLFHTNVEIDIKYHFKAHF